MSHSDRFPESPNLEGVLEHAARPAGLSPNLLSSIATWLSIDFALPEDYQHPRIEFVSPMRMAAIRYRAFGTGLQASVVKDDQSAEKMRDTMALYEDASRCDAAKMARTGGTRLLPRVRDRSADPETAHGLRLLSF